MASRTTSLLLAVTHSNTQYIVAARPGHIRCLVRFDGTASLVTAVKFRFWVKIFRRVGGAGMPGISTIAEEEITQIRQPAQAIQ